MNKGLLLVLALLVLILTVVVGIGGFIVYNNHKQQQDLNINNQTTTHEEKKEEKENSEEALFKADCDEFILNISDSKGKTRIMKLSFSVKSSNINIVKVVEELKSEINDKLISMVSVKTSEELLTNQGKIILKEEILKEINLILLEYKSPDGIKVNIKNVLLTSLVIK